MPKPESKVVEGANKLSTFFQLLGKQGVDVDAFIRRMMSGKQLKYLKRICTLIRDGGVYSLSEAEIALRKILGTRASENVFGAIEWSNHLGVIPPDKLPSLWCSEGLFDEICPLADKPIRERSFCFLGLPEFEEGKSVGLREISSLLRERGIHLAADKEVMKTKVSPMQLAWYMTPACYDHYFDFSTDLHEVPEAPAKYRAMTTIEYIMMVVMADLLIVNRETAQWGYGFWAKTTTGCGKNLYVNCGRSTLYVYTEEEALERVDNHYFLPITRILGL